MTYTTFSKLGAVTYTRVMPLDPQNIQIACSVVIPHFRTQFSDPLIELYAATALGGTQKHSKKDIDIYLKRYGITLNIRAQKDTIHFSLGVRREHVAHAVKLLSEIIFHPKRSPDELEKKRTLLLEENREAHDDAKRIASINFTNSLYSNIASMRELTLSEEQEAIHTLDIGIIHQLEHTVLYGEWYITFVGNDTDDHQLVTFMRTLEATATHIDIPLNVTTLQPAKHTYVTVPGKTNVELRIGNIIPLTPRDPSYIPLMFGISVLGHVGGFSGRLMSTVREKEGLTYGIYATTVEHFCTSTTHWNIFTFFSARDLKKGTASTLRELSKIITQGITDHELRIFKEILKNAHILAHDSHAKRLKLYHNIALLGQNEEETAQEYEKVAQLTRKDVNTALRSYIDEDVLIISGAGPVDKQGNGILD